MLFVLTQYQNEIMRKTKDEIDIASALTSFTLVDALRGTLGKHRSVDHHLSCLTYSRRISV